MSDPHPTAYLDTVTRQEKSTQLYGWIVPTDAPHVLLRERMLRMRSQGNHGAGCLLRSVHTILGNKDLKDTNTLTFEGCYSMQEFIANSTAASCLRARMLNQCRIAI